RFLAVHQREETTGQRQQQPGDGDLGGMPQHRQHGFRAVRTDRDVGQRHRERDDHAGGEPVPDLRVTLDDQRRGHHHARGRQHARDDPDDRVRGRAAPATPHHVFPLRISVATPITATSSTVISTSVSRPRKSATMAVTTSPPCASGASRMWSSDTLSAAGLDKKPHTVTKAASPAIDPATTSRLRRFLRTTEPRSSSGSSCGSRASAATKTSASIVSTITATSATSGAPISAYTAASAKPTTDSASAIASRDLERAITSVTTVMRPSNGRITQSAPLTCPSAKAPSVGVAAKARPTSKPAGTSTAEMLLRKSRTSSPCTPADARSRPCSIAS